MSNLIQGKNNILYVWDSAAYRPIACLTSNNLSETQNIIESQTKCSPDTIVKIPGIKSYELSAEGEYIDTTSTTGETTKASHDYLRSLMGTEVEWKMDTGLTDTDAYYGTAIISDLSLDNPADGISTFSCTLSGSGAIATVDPNA